jgi:preprotein translocase subunit SecA
MFTVLRALFPISFGLDDLGEVEDLDAEELAERVVEDALEAYRAKELDVGSEDMRELERWILLRTIDSRWRDHLYEMDYLREGIGLRALAQKDPLVEYKSEGFAMFQAMMDSIQEDFVRMLFRVEVRREPAADVPRLRELNYTAADDSAIGGSFVGVAAGGGAAVADGSARAFQDAQRAGQGVTPPRHVDKVGRNDPCPCGSGKKYKKCHGAAE